MKKFFIGLLKAVGILLLILVVALAASFGWAITTPSLWSLRL